jgi:secondary thiamine-phosphate synthase enzyme
MRAHSDYLTLQTKQNREFVNITQAVRAAVEKSGVREGIVLVGALHSNAALFINEDNAALLADVDTWLARQTPASADHKAGPHRESGTSVHLQNLLLQGHVVVGVTDTKLELELGPWQGIIYAELDGCRPKRVLIKVLGE